MLRSTFAATLVAIGLLSGCVVAPYPYAVPAATQPSTYDRAFDAALGAISGQGLSITTQDRASGMIVGRRGNTTISASVRPQADGTTRVSFDQGGPAGQEPQLVQQVVADYNRRMGR
jgi:hypothetical protein